MVALYVNIIIMCYKKKELNRQKDLFKVLLNTAYILSVADVSVVQIYFLHLRGSSEL